MKLKRNSIGTNKNTSNTANTPKNDAAAPLAFASQAFTEAWKAYEAHRQKIRKPMSEAAVRINNKKLAAMGEVNAILALENSVANGWQGIFAPDEPGRPTTNGHQAGPAPASLDDLKGYKG